MATKVAERLQHDQIKLRFTTTHPTNYQPKAILRRSLSQSIQEIVSQQYGNPSTLLILYERLEVSIIELETKRSLKIIWTGVHNQLAGLSPWIYHGDLPSRSRSRSHARLYALEIKAPRAFHVFFAIPSIRARSIAQIPNSAQ